MLKREQYNMLHWIKILQKLEQQNKTLTIKSVFYKYMHFRGPILHRERVNSIKSIYNTKFLEHSKNNGLLQKKFKPGS